MPFKAIPYLNIISFIIIEYEIRFIRRVIIMLPMPWKEKLNGVFCLWLALVINSLSVSIFHRLQKDLKEKNKIRLQLKWYIFLVIILHDNTFSFATLKGFISFSIIQNNSEQQKHNSISSIHILYTRHMYIIYIYLH